MPKQFHPRKRGAHRIACIALYRALLSKCSLIDVPPSLHRGRIHPIKWIVRRQFRRNVHVESAPLVVAALKVGYEADELLHTANTGDKAAHSKILELLRGVQAQGDAARAQNAIIRPLPPPPKIRPRSGPYPGAPRLIDQRPRPKSQITNVRHVPKLASANSFPFLRIKKPQPAFLSRVLKDKIVQRQKRFDAVDKLDDLATMAKAEEHWDALAGIRDNFKWQTAAEDEKAIIKQRLNNTTQANIVLAKKMLAIVDEEQRLAGLEKEDLKMEKREKRRQAREEGAALGEGGFRRRNL